MRYFSTSSALLLSLVASAVAAPLAAPQDGTVSTLGSKKNVYLSTCSSRGLLGLFDRDSSSTVIYYNGPSNSNRSPTDVAVVSEPARNWEGSTRRARIVAGQFTSSISDGAQDLPKSAIAGSAKLGDEDLICFKDGVTTFQFKEGLLGLQSSTCRADYWCASIEV